MNVFQTTDPVLSFGLISITVKAKLDPSICLSMEFI